MDCRRRGRSLKMSSLRAFINIWVAAFVASRISYRRKRLLVVTFNIGMFPVWTVLKTKTRAGDAEEEVLAPFFRFNCREYYKNAKCLPSKRLYSVSQLVQIIVIFFIYNWREATRLSNHFRLAKSNEMHSFCIFLKATVSQLKGIF